VTGRDSGARRRRTRVAGAWAAVAALLGACGQPATLDDDRTEASIRSRLADTYGVSVGSVSCPDDIEVADGARFRCRATVAGGAVEVDVRQTDGDGALAVEPTRAVLVTDRVADDIVEVLADRFDRDDATVTCEGPAVRVERVGASFRCLAADGDEARVVEVRVRDVRGALTYTLVPPAGA